MLKNCGAAFALTALIALGGIALHSEISSPKSSPQQRADIYDPCKETDEKSIERCTNYRLSSYTGWLAVFTAVLAVVSGTQIAFLISADKTARTSADAAKLAANAAVEQSKLAGLQLDLIEKQHGVARLQFFSANRPRLVVHFVRRIIEHPDTPTDEQAIAVEFRLMNVGTSDAWISESRIAVARFIPGRWPHPDELVGEDLITRPAENRHPFPVGTSNRFIARSSVSEGLVDRMEIEAEDRLIQLLEDRGAETTGRLYLIGWIVYEDPLQNPLTLYFSREYDRKTGRFTPAQDCDWEERYD